MSRIKRSLSSILIFVMVLTSVVTLNVGEVNAAAQGGVDALVAHAISHEGQTYKLNGCEKFAGDWCMSFIAHCAYKTGNTRALPYNPKNQKHSTLGVHTYSEKIVNQYKAKITFVNKNAYSEHKNDYVKATFNKNYKPEKGDLVIYSWASDRTSRDHVGLVVSDKRKGEPILFLEGNTGSNYYTSSQVLYRTYEYRKSNIIAYVTPNYQSFTAKYNPNCSGAWGSMAATTMPFGIQTPLSKNQFIRNGYAFTGWTAKRDDGTWLYVNPKNENQSNWYKEGKAPRGWEKYVYRDEQTVARTHTKNNGVVTFYAQWEKTKSHWFYYSLDGGKTIGELESMYVIEGRPFCVWDEQPKKSGYTFTGWTVRRVKDKKCYVSGKGWLSESEIKNRGLNKKIYKFGEVYYFTGSWTKGCSGSSHYIFEAQWKKNPAPAKKTYTVRYIANGGSGSMADTVVTYGTNTRLRPNQFTRNGYTFAGWAAQRDDGTWRYYNPKNISQERWCYEGQEPYGWKKYVYGNQVNVSKSYSKNKGVVYFYAQWKQNAKQTFIVKYNPNGGYGSMANTTVVYGKATPLRNNQFVRDGYKFVGWTAKRDNNTWRYIQPGGGKDGWYAEGKQPSGWKKYVYKNQENVLYSYNKDKGVVTFYAQWENAQVHTFYYDTNGGSTPPPSMDVADGERFSVTGRFPTKDGYTFEGWTIHRLADDKYYVIERGWFTNEEIDYEGYTKRIYTPGESYRLDKAWTTGYAGTSDYIFEAQWKENETYEPVEPPEPPAPEAEVIGFVSEEEFEQRYAGNSNYEATPYYRYATRQKEYTESTSSNLDGWTLYNQVTVPGSSAWSKTKPASGAYETGYQYYCWGWEHNGDWTFYYDNDYNNAVSWIKKNYTVWNYNQFRYFWQVYSTNKGNSVKVSQTVNYRDNNGKTGTKAISDTKLWYDSVVYRQKASTKYQFWRWGSWSGWSSWSTEQQATSDTVKEELQYYIVKK